MDSRELVERYARTADPQYFAADASFHDIARDEASAGRQAIATMLRSLLYEAFSEVEIAVRTVVVDPDGDRAAIEWIFRGRHTGDLWGIALTGRRVELPMLGVYEIQDGSIRAARLYYDLSTLMSQLGQVPKPVRRGPTTALRADPVARARRWVAGLLPRWRRARELGGIEVARLVRGIRDGLQPPPRVAAFVRGRRRPAGLLPRWRRPRQVRRVTVVALVGTIVVAVLIGQAVLSPAPAAAAEASLTILDGAVGVSRGDRGFVTATDGQRVRSGDTVRTGDGAHAVLTYFDGSTATIEPLSEVVVEEMVARSGELVVSIRQTIGHTWHVITRSRSGRSNYHVRTPSASAVVRGTAFEVKLKPKAGFPQELVTEVATTDGEVGVTSPAAPEIEVKVPEGTKTDVGLQARPTEPEAIPEPDVKVKVTLDAVPNAIVVQQNGLAVGVQQGQAVRYAPGSKVKVENGKLVMEIPNAKAGRLSSIVEGSSTDRGSVHIETEISTGSVVVARTVEDRQLERSEDPARSASVAKGGLILTPVGVVVLPDDEAKKAVDANIGKAPVAPPAPAGLVPNVAPRIEQRPAIIVPEPSSPPPGAVATATAPPAATAPFAGTFQAFALTGIPSVTPSGPQIPGASGPGPAATALSLDALPPQVLSVLFATNPGHLAKPAALIETAAPASVAPAFVPPGQIGTAPPTAPGVFCDQRGQPPGCIPPQTTAFVPGGIFAPGGVFGIGGFFDPTRAAPQVPGATSAPRALFTAPPAPVLDGTCGLAGFRACFAGETPRPGLVPFGNVAPAQAPCGIPGDARCSSSTPIQGITCDFAGGPSCPPNAAPAPPGVTAAPGATFPGGFPPAQGVPVFCDQRGQPPGCIAAGGAFVPGATAVPFFDGTCGLAGLRPCFPGETTRPGVVAPQLTGDGNCGLPTLRGCFANETPRPGLVAGPSAVPGTFPGITGPTRGITCDGPALPTCPPNAVDAPPGFVPGQPIPGFDGNCGQAGLRGCFAGETPRPGLTAPPAFSTPLVAPPGQIGTAPPTAPGIFCDQFGRPAGCIPFATPFPGGVPPAQGAPVYCDQRGQPPGCITQGVTFTPRPVTTPVGDGTCGLAGLRPCFAGETTRPGASAPPSGPIAPSCGIPGDARCNSGTPIQGITCGYAGGPTCPSNALPPGSTTPPQTGPVLPYCDGVIITTNCRPSPFTPPPGGTAPPQPVTPQPAPTGQIGTAPPTAPGVYCDQFGRPAGCIPGGQTFAPAPVASAPVSTFVPAPSGAPVYCDQNGQPPGCIPGGQTFAPAPVLPYCDGVIITTNCRPSAFTPPPTTTTVPAPSPVFTPPPTTTTPPPATPVPTRTP